MKTSIIIKGQPQSVNALLKAIETPECEKQKLPFNSYELIFSHKSKALQALIDARKKLKSDKEGWRASHGKYKRGDVLMYDAASAKIVKTY